MKVESVEFKNNIEKILKENGKNVFQDISDNFEKGWLPTRISDRKFQPHINAYYAEELIEKLANHILKTMEEDDYQNVYIYSIEGTYILDLLEEEENKVYETANTKLEVCGLSKILKEDDLIEVKNCHKIKTSIRFKFGMW